MQLIDHFYPENNDLKRTLIRHSENVRSKALEIAGKCGLELDLELVSRGAMLHDIGIFKCHAPDIFCTGSSPYITHGIIGGKLLRQYGAENHLDLERCARICERHTGSGLSVEDIFAQRLPLPEKDFLPETLEEKLICLADKFYSKSGSGGEKSLEAVRRSFARFSGSSQERLEELIRLFKCG